MDDVESETDPNYELSKEDDNKSESDLDLGHGVSVDWTTVLPNELTQHSFSHNVIYDNERYDSYDIHTLLECDV